MNDFVFFEPVPASESSGPHELWPEGEYRFQVASAKYGTAQTGRQYLELAIDVYDDRGGKTRIWDRLFAGAKAGWKVRAFCESAGCLKAYEAGKFGIEEALAGFGSLKLGVEKGTGGYADRNVVATYLPQKAEQVFEQQRQQTAASVAAGEQKDCPF